MKKLFLLLALFLTAMVSYGQETKKIAILEPVDRDGSVTYAHKLMLRANLSKAIANTPGYEAYDRSDMDAIMSEQDFQRTGMVSNDQIKRLGEMTGAQFILVSEAVKVDENNMFITAKILNVESAKTEMTDNVLMGTSAANIQNGCINLAQKLLGIAPNMPEIDNNQGSSSRNSRQQQQQRPVTVARPTNTTPSVAVGKPGSVGTVQSFSDGSRGVVFYADGKGHGLVVSLEEGEAKWDKTKGRDVQDIYDIPNMNDAAPYIAEIGKGNSYTDAILRQLPFGICPAAEWCRSLGEGWYLPTASELSYLFKVANEGKSKFGTISRALEAAGGAPLNGGWYWTSSEVARNEVVNISDGGAVATEKKAEENKVRAIKAF